MNSVTLNFNGPTKIFIATYHVYVQLWIYLSPFQLPQMDVLILEAAYSIFSPFMPFRKWISANGWSYIKLYVKEKS